MKIIITMVKIIIGKIKDIRKIMDIINLKLIMDTGIIMILEKKMLIIN